MRKAKIERWDDNLHTHFHVMIPLTFWIKCHSQRELTTLMVKLIRALAAKEIKAL